MGLANKKKERTLQYTTLHRRYSTVHYTIQEVVQHATLYSTLHYTGGTVHYTIQEVVQHAMLCRWREGRPCSFWNVKFPRGESARRRGERQGERHERKEAQGKADKGAITW